MNPAIIKRKFSDLLPDNRTFRSLIRDYFIAFLAISLTAAVCFPLSGTMGYQAVGLILLMVVALLSLVMGRGAVLFAAVLNFCVWNFFFIPPLFTFQVHNIHNVIALFASLIVAIVGGTLITRIRKSQSDLKKSKERISLLYSFLELLNNTRSIKEIVNVTQDRMKTQFDAETVLYLKEKEGNGLARRPFGNILLYNENEFLAAEHAFENRIRTGKFTNLFSHSAVQYFPLAEHQMIPGVIGLSFKNDEKQEEDTQLLLKSFIVQIASALEREISVDLAKEKEIYSESEKLFQTVLSSVSHELRTPMAIISAAVSSLNDEKTSSNPEIRKQVCEELDFASKRMNNLVENFLDMSRLESGYLQLNLQYCDIEDLIGMVVHTMKNELKSHQLLIKSQENLPLIKADARLLNQALFNILHNAVTYSQVGTAIIIRSKMNEKNQLVVEISDQGKGVPAHALPRLFDKFYRIPGSVSGGMGLGLTITKAIVEVHKGSIFAENCPDGGLKISMIFIPADSNG